MAAAAAAPAAISHAPLASRQTQLYRGSRTVTTGMVPGLPAPRVALSDQSTQTGTPAEPGPAPQSDGQRLAATTASVPSQTDASLLRGLFHGMPPAVGVDAYRHRLAVAQAAAADLATAEAVAAAIAAAQAEDEPATENIGLVPARPNAAAKPAAGARPAAASKSGVTAASSAVGLGRVYPSSLSAGLAASRTFASLPHRTQPPLARSASDATLPAAGAAQYAAAANIATGAAAGRVLARKTKHPRTRFVGPLPMVRLVQGFNRSLDPLGMPAGLAQLGPEERELLGAIQTDEGGSPRGPRRATAQRQGSRAGSRAGSRQGSRVGSPRSAASARGVGDRSEGGDGEAAAVAVAKPTRSRSQARAPPSSPQLGSSSPIRGFSFKESGAGAPEDLELMERPAAEFTVGLSLYGK